MDEFLRLVSDLLGVSVETAIELYPVLRKQFVSYKILIIISNVSWIAFWGLIILIALIWRYSKHKKYEVPARYGYYSMDEYRTAYRGYLEEKAEHEAKIPKYDNISKKLIIAVVGVLIVIIVTGILSLVLAPDLLLLKDFI